MNFVFSGLPVERFRALFAMSDAELRERGIFRLAAEPASPCRITLQEADVGEPLLLLPFEHQPAATPYRSSGPIFVRERARQTARFDEVPAIVRTRLMSVRAYDAGGMMIDADVVDGSEIEPCLERLFAQPSAAYVHLHNARRGCYACRVDRA